MATITASVGRLGVNRPDDVRFIQDKLNRVPPEAGGPSPLLVVDSLCGPKTKDAIHYFQSAQFGWLTADGRVDVDGPTLKRLNELTGGPMIGKPGAVLSTGTTMTCPHGGSVQVRLVGGRRDRTPDGHVALTPMDLFVISGCPFTIVGSPQPCSHVQWMESGQFLSNQSVGLCLSGSEVPQGTVLIVANAPRNSDFVLR